ncbi:MAG: carbon-nitrogen hydrolase family protein [Deltaproteobacteria bacterium]|nr:carbon-nitrogen hydrolase family protein [Deltaproteobacteria bacterium]
MIGSSLRVGVVHLDVEHGNAARNRDQLVWLCRSAAAMGAKIICAPEMCVSGYVHNSRRDIAPLLETAVGKTMETVRGVAVESQAFIAVGLAEKDAVTDVPYNSAFVIAPTGETVCRYRKINAESRWASPGEAAQNNVFRTPWGGVGLLICSDSYHSLLPRVTAVKGASLILLPCNWPKSDDGFPLSLWRLRAMENGVWLLAVNRGGREETIDFSKARSYLIEPNGTAAKGFASGVEERVRVYDIPLRIEGHVIDLRQDKLLKRQTNQYQRVYSNISRVKNLTTYLGLPGPGVLDVHALAPGETRNPAVYLAEVIETFKPGSLALLPLYRYTDDDLKSVNALSKKSGVAVLGMRLGAQRPQFFSSRLTGRPVASDMVLPVYEWGPARIMQADLESLWHPELAVSAAKNGVDLVVCSAMYLNGDDKTMLTLRPIDQVAVAASSPSLALVSLIPQGHGPGRGSEALSGHVAAYPVDTGETRKKDFQELVDYPTLFGKPLLAGAWSPKTHS